MAGVGAMRFTPGAQLGRYEIRSLLGDFSSLVSTTVNCAVPPASVVVSPDVGVTVTPATSSSTTAR